MEKPSKIDLLDERSEEVQEILGTAPSWPVRWGSTVIFSVVGLLILLSWIIRYPDAVTAKVVITTTNPPYRVIARSDGKIKGLKYKDNDVVKKDSIVGVLDNPANLQDVLYLENIIEKIKKDVSLIYTLPLKASLRLGEVQGDYNAFVNAITQKSFYNINQPFEKQLNALQVQLGKSKELLVKQERKCKLLKNQLDLAKVDYDRDKLLFDQKVVSQKALEEKEQILLKATEALNEGELDLMNAQLKLLDLEKQRETLTLESNQVNTTLQQTTIDAFKKLEASVLSWEQKYVLRTPITGKISLYSYWSEDQFVKAGDEVMIIVPEDTNMYIVGKMFMPIQNSGKVQVGQKVNIYLDNYPFQEYGIIKGIVSKISLVPKNNTYAVEVELPGKLRSSYNKELDFRQELQGNAEIITEDLTLAQRIFYSLRKLFHQKKF